MITQINLSRLAASVLFVIWAVGGFQVESSLLPWIIALGLVDVTVTIRKKRKDAG